MLISRRFVLLSWAVVSGSSATAKAEQEAKPLLTDADVPLAKLLYPPYAADSDGAKAELAAVKNYVATCTEDGAKYAAADDDVSINHFLATMGIPIDIYSLAQTKNYFESLAATVEAVVNPAKQAFNRARPSALDASIKPPLQPKNPLAYPSSHATLGFLFDITLSDIAPEKQAAFFARANGYGYARYILGLNFVSDIEVSNAAAAAIAAVLWRNAEVTKQFAAVKTELRPAMGLWQLPP